MEEGKERERRKETSADVTAIQEARGWHRRHRAEDSVGGTHEHLSDRKGSAMRSAKYSPSAFAMGIEMSVGSCRWKI